MVILNKVNLRENMFSEAHEGNLIMEKSAKLKFQTTISQAFFKIKIKINAYKSLYEGQTT